MANPDPYKEQIPEKTVSENTHSAPLPVKKSDTVGQKLAQPEVSMEAKKVTPPADLPTGNPENIPKFEEEHPQEKASKTAVETTPTSAPEQKPMVEEAKDVAKGVVQKEIEAKEDKVPDTALESEVEGILSASGLGQDVEEGKKIVQKAKRSGLRTYESDVAAAIRDQKASVASVRQAEVKKRDQNIGQPDPTIIKSKQNLFSKLNWNKIFIGLVILLLVLGGGVFLLSTLSEEKPKEVRDFEENVVRAEEFFFVEGQQEFSLSELGPNAFRNALAERRGETIANLDEMVQIYFTEERGAGKRLVPFSELTSSLGIDLPGILDRNIDDKFMFGIHVFDGNEVFLVLKTQSYGNAFSGMLAWEKTLQADWKGIFTPTNEETLRNATTTGAILNLRYEFKDKVVSNRDTRYIEDDSGETLLIYSFVSTDTIVLASNEDTLEEIIDRLARIRFER